MIRIVQLRRKCIGCFACVEVSPDRWRMSRRDGKSVLIGGVPKRDHFIATVSDAEKESALRAKANCPVNIIQVVENGKGTK